MTEPRLPDYLEHIRQAARQSVEFVQNMDKSAFVADIRTQFAVIRCLIIIGEAATKIMERHPEFVTAHPEVPWRDMRRTRNRVTHGYFDINLDAIWDTTQIYLPELLEKLPPTTEA